nr:hypothetical protein BACY1_16340 [Tenacibaculum mesophilum]
MLFEILKKDDVKEETSINCKEEVGGILKKNVEAVLLSFIEKIPEIGKPLKEIIQAFDKVEKEILELYQKEFKTPEVNSFISRIENTKGSIFEHDIITTYIDNKLNEIKGEDREKKNVLILDDLDRIEPEHIFRLLNIFSANFDNSEYSINKFGIDKVIIVADYYNIKSIYHHKYGKNSDFEGYINKFYSNEIYFLTFYDTLKILLEKDYHVRESSVFEFIELKVNLLVLLFNNKQLNFRQINKLSIKDFNTGRSLDGIINDLVSLFNGDYRDLTDALSKVSVEKDTTIKEVFWEKLLKCLILFSQENEKQKIKRDGLSVGEPNFIYSFHSGGEIVFRKENDRKTNLRLIGSFSKLKVWKEFLNYLKNKYE